MKELSENCKLCSCSSCYSSHNHDEQNWACLTWCEENCKGEDPEKELSSCYKSL
jgi:hypothetical protein